MWKDPIVTEIHAIREQIARECNYDLKRIMDRLRNKENEIISKFAQHGLFQGRELYLKVHVALEFLADCQENDLAIIGVEVFRNENNYLIPLLDHIADFSYYETAEWEEFKNSCNESCKSFLLGLSKENKIVFNFTLMTRDEWEDKRIS